MKKLLLTLAAAATVFAASAAPTQLNKVWTKQVVNAFPADKTEFSAKIAVDAAGNVIAAGAYNQDFTLGTTEMTAVGTGAYLAKYNLAGELAWAVPFSGSASVVAIDTDADGNIFVAGRLADEVEFGTTSGTPVTKEGLKIDGAPVSTLDASFIAKYSADGVLDKVEVYAPEPMPELVATGMYFPFEGYMYFHINNIKIADSKLYVSAVYTDKTTIGDVAFEGSYNDPWGGVFFNSLKSTAVFTLDLNLSGCAAVVTCGVDGHLATEEGEYQAGIVEFAVEKNHTYAVFLGNGPLVVKSGSATKTLEAEPSQYNYILTDIADNAIGQLATVPCPEAGINTSYIPAFVGVNGENLIVVGDETFAENYQQDNERIGTETFVITAPLSKLADATKKAQESIDGDITYAVVSSAALLSSGEIYINTLGYYNTTKVEGEETLYRKGDFAGKVKSFVYTDNAFAPATAVADAYAVAAAGEYVAFGQIAETGADFSLYTSKSSGISDIVVEDADAPAVYYNLQGIQVANPENGIYIVRRGSKVSKVVK